MREGRVSAPVLSEEHDSATSRVRPAVEVGCAELTGPMADGASPCEMQCGSAASRQWEVLGSLQPTLQKKTPDKSRRKPQARELGQFNVEKASDVPLGRQKADVNGLLVLLQNPQCRNTMICDTVPAPSGPRRDIYGGRKINIYASAGRRLPNAARRADFLPDGPFLPPCNLCCHIAKQHKSLARLACFQRTEVYASPPARPTSVAWRLYLRRTGAALLQ